MAIGTVSEARVARAGAPLAGFEGTRLADLLGQIYEAALEPSAWATCLESIRSLFGANYVSLIVRPGSGDDLGLYNTAVGTYLRETKKGYYELGRCS